jgi:chromosome segregation ATPase
MFAKRAKPPSQLPPPPHDGRTVEAGVDPRAEQIDRLERELGEQREAAKGLREALDAATFKIEILEKSYATQLAEVRDKRAALEAELKEKDEILANLGGGHEHTLRELNDALTVIKVLKTERDQLRKQIAQGGFRPHGESKARRLLGSDHTTSATAKNTSDDDTSGGTINALIANAGWAEKKPAVGAGQATAQVEAEQEPAHHEMLSPDLVFTAKDKEADDER